MAAAASSWQLRPCKGSARPRDAAASSASCNAHGDRPSPCASAIAARLGTGQLAHCASSPSA
eukprot:3309093-Prymnesium_polylepis.1